VTLPKTFTAGERLFAADLNSNFEEIDERSTLVVYSGSVSSSIARNSTEETSITFPFGLFGATPNVVVSLSRHNQSAVNSDNIRVYANSVTSSGFTLRVVNNEINTYTLGRRWVAIGVATGNLPKTFTSGERLFASDLNENFEHLDKKTSFGATLASGSLTLNSVGQREEVSTFVKFPTGRFSSAPNVIVNWSRSDANTTNARTMNAFATSITSSGFNFRITNNGTTASDVNGYWLAVQN